MLTNMHATSGMLISSIQSDRVEILIFVHTNFIACILSTVTWLIRLTPTLG